MRVLFISNFYPGQDTGSVGGYELWCQEIAEGLQARGHEVHVLSTFRGISRDDSRQGPTIRQDLQLELAGETGLAWRQFLCGYRQRTQHDLRCLQDAVASFEPEVIMIWGMWNLPMSLAALAEQLRPVIYYVGDVWPILSSELHRYRRRTSHNPLRRRFKSLFSAVALLWLPPDRHPIDHLRFDHVLCPSQYMGDLLIQAGLPSQRIHLVPGAIDTSPLVAASRQSHRSGTETGLSLLWLGRLAEGKGVETAIRGLGVLKRQQPTLPVFLTIAGPGSEGYLADLRHLAAQERVEAQVTFVGPVPRRKVPDLYAQFDAFLFTSALPESFGRVLAEAMAAGLPVVATTAGGAIEILDGGRYGLVFEQDDPAALASQILRLAGDEPLRRHYAATGQHWVCSQFDTTRMITQIESHLQERART